MKLTCPKCGREYHVEASAAGREAECECGESFIIAAPVPKAPPPVAKSAPIELPPTKGKPPATNGGYDWRRDPYVRVCATCGMIIRPQKTMGGNCLIEGILWLLIIPGAIYSVWRLASKASVCPSCGSKELVQVNSPVGQRIIRENMSSEYSHK